MCVNKPSWLRRTALRLTQQNHEGRIVFIFEYIIVADQNEKESNK